MTKAPWTEEEVKALNLRQMDPERHPYTCGSGNRTDVNHLDKEGVLVAYGDGWHCPYCDYKQDWCHDADVSQAVADTQFASNFQQFVTKNKISLTDEQRVELDKLLD